MEISEFGLRNCCHLRMPFLDCSALQATKQQEFDGCADKNKNKPSHLLFGKGKCRLKSVSILECLVRVSPWFDSNGLKSIPEEVILKFVDWYRSSLTYVRASLEDDTLVTFLLLLVSAICSDFVSAKSQI